MHNFEVLIEAVGVLVETENANSGFEIVVEAVIVHEKSF